MLQWAGLLHFLWCFVIQAVLEFINCIAVTNRNLIFYQLFYNELKSAIAFHRSDLKTYKTIGSYCEVFILLKKRSKAYKVKAKIELGRLLTILGSKTYLVYMFIRNTVTKTPFIKLYEPKNLLVLERVLKPIRIRPLNDVAIIENSTGERVLLDLSKIDDIDFSKFTTLEALRSPRPLELPTPRLFKFPKLEKRPSELIFRLFEELIKPVDFSDPDEI